MSTFSASSPSTSLSLETPLTLPFVVITNECQWEESEGLLLKKVVFGDRQEIEWPFLANIVQRHFLRATRQDLIRPTRSLSPSDFDFILNKIFGGHPMISQKSFDNFWNWFGKVVQKLRYQRHICGLWQSGLIHGFLSREQIYQALIGQPVGTFLIRFSERNPGCFAVAYKVDDEDPKCQIRHYLVRPDDTAGSKKTLPDFLADQPAFVYLLQVTFNNGHTTFHKFLKDSVLEVYYSKKSSLPPSLGYDDNILLANKSSIE